MLKKISLALFAFAILLSANTKNIDNIDCDEQFESCIIKCDNTNNDDCIEKCEQELDKCLFEKETNQEQDLEENSQEDNNNFK
ncbi:MULTISPECIES: hypothetical protein [Arcobacteraceae]|uniref:Transmembrane protein n=1 Tax=Poseidonibacter parvus TaxID=1850254 RepID=A0A1P8KKB1_9BACT|nr:MULTISPECIES: hypothetical protein [Arcobacteraceae]APW64989.1 hypothetical protein LPB137_03640 [Poseidonibacter parvus]